MSRPKRAGNSTKPKTPAGFVLSQRALRPGARPRLLSACLGILMLTACSPAAELDDGAAAELQDRVSVAKQLTAEQNFPAALAALQQLSQEVISAADQGLMSQERKTRIQAAISAIEADLEAALAPQTSAPEQPAPTTESPADGKEQEETRQAAEKRSEEARKKAEEQLEETQNDEERQKGNRGND